MKPTRLLLIWLGVLSGLNILLGAATALQLKVPDTLHSVAWGLLLALFLLALLDALRAEGCNVLGNSEASEYGKFGWVLDPEGNKVELWQPPVEM